MFGPGTQILVLSKWNVMMNLVLTFSFHCHSCFYNAVYFRRSKHEEGVGTQSSAAEHQRREGTFLFVFLPSLKFIFREFSHRIIILSLGPSQFSVTWSICVCVAMDLTLKVAFRHVGVDHKHGQIWVTTSCSGDRGRHPNMSGTTSYAKNVDGSDGRHRYDQRRQRNFARNHCSTSGREIYDRNCTHTGWRGKLLKLAY